MLILMLIYVSELCPGAVSLYSYIQNHQNQVFVKQNAPVWGSVCLRNLISAPVVMSE